MIPTPPKRVSRYGIIIISASLLVSLVAVAGSLTPPGVPAGTMKTLQEIYDTVAGTFDSSLITSDQDGSVIQGLKYISENLFWASSSNDIYTTNTGNVGIGTTAPGAKLDVVGGNLVVRRDDDDAVIIVEGIGPQFIGHSFNGTLASPTAVLTDDYLFNLKGRGYDGSDFNGAVEIIGAASEGWTGSANGSYLSFVTTTTGTLLQDERMRISDAGNVGIGTTNPTTKLDVLGNASVSSNFEVGGNLSFFGEIQPDGATCANGQILKKMGPDDWDCAPDSTGGGGGSSHPFREGSVGAFTNVSSVSFEAGHFDLTFPIESGNVIALIKLDWVNGPASLSQNETVTGFWNFGNNVSISSGFNLEVAGYASASQTFGSGLTDCDLESQTLNWDATTGRFSCLTDGGGGGSVASDSLDFDEFVDAMTLDADTTITGGLFALTFDHASVSGDFEIGGNITSGTSISGNFDPTIDNTYDLGSLDLRWKSVNVGPGSFNITSTTGTSGSGTDYTLGQISFPSGSSLSLGTQAVGAGNAGSVELRTNNLARLFVGSGGNVGVGTTAPATKFEVAGAASFSQLFGVGLTECNDIGEKLLWVASGSSAGKFTCGSDQQGAGSAGGWTDDGTTVRLSTITDSVGIGDTTPETKFEVVGAASIGLGTITLNLNAGTNITNINTGTTTGDVTIGGGSNDFVINTNDWDVSLAGAFTGISTLDTTGLITSAGGITSTGGTVNLNVSAGTNTTNLGTGTTTGDVFIGGGSNDFVIDTNDWDITAAGVLSGLTQIEMNGTASISGTINLNISAGANTTNIGTGTTSGDVSLGGNANDIIIDSNNWDVSQAGLISTTGGLTATGTVNLNVNAGTNVTNINTGTSTGNVTIGANGINQDVIIQSTDWDVSSTGAISSDASITSAGLLSSTGGLTATGTINLNVNAGTNTTSINTGTSTGNVTIGANGINQDVIIQSTDWDVSTTGAISTDSTITSAGLLSSTGGANITGGTTTLLGSAASNGIINIGTNSTNGGVITLGNNQANQNVNVATSNWTVTNGAQTTASLATTGLLSSTGGANITGGTTTLLGSAASNGIINIGTNSTNGGVITIGNNQPNQDVIIATNDWAVSATGAISTDSTITADGLITGTGGLTVSAGTINLGGDVSNGIINIGTTSTNAGVITIGNGLPTLAINTNDWDISTTGVMTGISGITTNGGYTQSGASVNTFSGDVNVLGNISAGVGTVSSPSYSFAGDRDTGIWRSTTNTLNFSTAALERMRIDSGGNVGIGTTAAGARFAVGTSSQFQVNSTGNIILLNNVATSFPSAQGAANSFLRNDGAGTLSWVNPVGTSGVAGYWERSGTSLFPTNIGDNVGIGTSVPGSKLDVSGNIAAGFGTVSSPSYSFIGDRDTGIWRSAANTLNFSTAALERMRIQSDGNVGIGTTAPSQPLHLYKAGGVASRMLVTQTGSGTDATAAVQLVGDDSNMFFGAADDAYTGVTEYAGKTFIQGDSGALALAAMDASVGEFQVYTGGRAAGNRRLTIDTAGNVGIGTSTGLTHKLKVEGKIFASTQGTATNEVLTAGRLVNTGAGLTGGGALTGDLTLSIPTDGVTNAMLLNSTFTVTAGTGMSGGGTAELGTSLSLSSTTWAASSGGNIFNLNAGNVGIGEDTPTSKLQVNGNTALGYAGAVTAPANGLTVSGNVGIGTTTAAEKLAVTGNVTVTGNITALGTITADVLVGSCNISISGTTSTEDGTVGTHNHSFSGSDGECADYAELYHSSEPVNPGDLVAFDPMDPDPSHVKKATQTNSHNIMGIVSTHPAAIIGNDLFVAGKMASEYHNENEPAVALVGRVPLKVSLENGPISMGDHLTASSVPGVAMKATEAGMTVGVAMWSPETNASGHTTVLTFVNVGYWAPDVASLGDGTLAGIEPGVIAQIINSVRDLIANGTLTLVRAVEGVFTSIKTDRIETGDLEVRNGITIFDSITGEPVCVISENNVLKSIPGACATATSTPAPTPESTAQGGEPLTESSQDSTSSPELSETTTPESNPEPESDPEPETGSSTEATPDSISETSQTL